MLEKLRVAAEAHDALQQRHRRNDDSPTDAELADDVPPDGAWATRPANHQLWDIFSLNGDEMAHQIRAKLLGWCAGLLGHPKPVSSAILQIYSAIVRDVYAVSGTEMWVVKLDCTGAPPRAAQATTTERVTGSTRPHMAESQHCKESPSILRTSTLNSAVQIQMELKGCTVPAWLPLTTVKQELPVPAAQPKSDWEAEADWSSDLSRYDSVDLWSADGPLMGVG